MSWTVYLPGRAGMLRPGFPESALAPLIDSAPSNVTSQTNLFSPDFTLNFRSSVGSSSSSSGLGKSVGTPLHLDTSLPDSSCTSIRTSPFFGDLARLNQATTPSAGLSQVEDRLLPKAPRPVDHRMTGCTG